MNPRVGQFFVTQKGQFRSSFDSRRSDCGRYCERRPMTPTNCCPNGRLGVTAAQSFRPVPRCSDGNHRHLRPALSYRTRQGSHYEGQAHAPSLAHSGTCADRISSSARSQLLRWSEGARTRRLTQIETASEGVGAVHPFTRVPNERSVRERFECLKVRSCRKSSSRSGLHRGVAKCYGGVRPRQSR